VLDIGAGILREFLRAVLRAKDLAFVINFDVDVDLDQDFNQQRARPDALAEQDADQCRHGRWPADWAAGPSRLTPRNAAVRRHLSGANEKLKNEWTQSDDYLHDGEDQGSRLKIQMPSKAAQKADTICYVILIADRGFYGGFVTAATTICASWRNSRRRVIEIATSRTS